MTKVSMLVGVKDGKPSVLEIGTDAGAVKAKFRELRAAGNAKGSEFSELQYFWRAHPNKVAKLPSKADLDRRKKEAAEAAKAAQEIKPAQAVKV